MSKQWKESAPSNIALIKYMGKGEGGGNVATNPSLSMTLANFRTTVELSLLPEGSDDAWDPLPGSAPLRRESTQRFLDFFQRLKKQESIHQAFLLRSGNNFPSDAGLASSASSFAALTKTAYTAFSELQSKPLASAEKLAMISRTGSGSSCRSFFSPWCVWEGEKIFVPPSKLPELEDVVVVLDAGFKKVSSSQAHTRVKSSPLFAGRTDRSVQRMQESLSALASGDFKRLAEISYAELWDMHSLFHTSTPPFFYFAPETLSVLRFVEDLWEKENWGPISTIDAGPNVHLLIPAGDKEKLLAKLQENLKFTPKYFTSRA